MDTTFGTDQTKRVTLDVNQVISPTLAIRAGGLFEDAGVAGRNTTDDRGGAFVAAKWTPIDAVKIYRRLRAHQPRTAFPTSVCPTTGRVAGAGKRLPQYRGRTVPAVRRQPANNFYGLVNRDFFQGAAGHRNDQHRGSRHAGSRPPATSSAPARSLEQLHRDDRRSRRSSATPLSALHDHDESAEPLSDHRRGCKPERGDLQVRHWRLQAHGGRLASRSRARSRSIDKYTGLSSKRCRAGTPACRLDCQASTCSSRNSPSRPFIGDADIGRPADQPRDRHRQRLSASTPPTTTTSSSSMAASAMTTTTSRPAGTAR